MGRPVTVEFSQFTLARLTDEAERQRVSIEELTTHAVLYFLADSDSGRIARRIPGRQDGTPRPEATQRLG